MKRIILTFMCSMFILTGCGKKSVKGVICTEIFAFVSVTIKNGVNAPVALDSFKVIRAIDNTHMTVKSDPSEFEIMQKSGSYTITNDNFVKELSNKNVEVIFMGSKGGKTVVNQTYTIGADQCHVSLIAGNPVVIVE